MRKNALRIFGLFFALTTLLTAVPRAESQTICPACIIGYKCCIQGQTAKCVPEHSGCNN
jgi:hypothetical protein